MRGLILLCAIAAVVGGLMIAADDAQPPGKLVFPSKVGDITFDHAAHVKREKGECASCHEKLWPKSTKVPLKSSDGCKACHKAGGKSFETRDNCVRCHPTGSQAMPKG
jgi:c(7)-type cytochrome triheme protein